ncbi:MAG: hypothetical protein IT324_26680 [Anaerolineae bacterium]|nr:hypothetical protein [Anaerolineae bacterium]
MAQQFTLIQVPTNIQSLCELPAGFKPGSFGTRAAVRALIAEMFPQADLSELIVITVNTDTDRAEIVLHGDPVEAIGLGNVSESVIRTLCERMGCRVVNTMTGDLDLRYGF